MGFLYGRLAGDCSAVAGLVSAAFNTPPDDAARWVVDSGIDNVRVLSAGRAQIGCMLRVPMGQWFGGRSVPMVGIAGVAVAPHERGRGAALQMMRSAMAELAEEEVPLSTLFASTQTLYRGAGFELGGQRIAYELDVRRLTLTKPDAIRDGRLSVRPFRGEDRAAVHKLHRRVSRRSTGMLDRGDYIWRRIEAPRGQTADGFTVWASGELEGYAFWTRTVDDAPGYALRLTDFCAATPRATRRLLRLVRDHGSLVRHAVIHDGPSPTFLPLLAEPAYRIEGEHRWMLRLTHLARALERRGYGAGLRGTLHLAVRDDLVRQNDGRFVLDVADGLAHVRAGGRGRVEVDARALASLYTGYLSAEQLRTIGWLRGPDRDLAIATQLFSGPPPGMTDMF